jgi:hypothetical protein
LAVDVLAFAVRVWDFCVDERADAADFRRLPAIVVADFFEVDGLVVVSDLIRLTAFFSCDLASFPVFVITRRAVCRSAGDESPTIAPATPPTTAPTGSRSKPRLSSSPGRSRHTRGTTPTRGCFPRRSQLPPTAAWPDLDQTPKTPSAPGSRSGHPRLPATWKSTLAPGDRWDECAGRRSRPSAPVPPGTLIMGQSKMRLIKTISFGDNLPLERGSRGAFVLSGEPCRPMWRSLGLVNFSGSSAEVRKGSQRYG